VNNTRTRTNLSALCAGLALTASAISCVSGDDGASVSSASITAAAADPGALVRMDMSSTVGVLLDEIPAGPVREAAAAQALAASTAFWTERATRQTKLTYYRLVFRGLYYSADWSSNPHARGPLPLPPKSTWNVRLSGRPRRVSLDGHDVVINDYTFSTHILTDFNSAGAVEPNLAAIGGTWDETFNLPVDPELILERTGYACMDEEEYPPGSVFEENPYYFYDDSCHVEAPSHSACHITRFPSESCQESLTRHVGKVRTHMHFTRVGWSASIANAVRVGTITNPTGADLTVVQSDMDEERAVFYRFFGPGSCEEAEGVIGHLGWRRLLAFSATVRNDGASMIHIGDVTDPSSPWIQSHVFEFSACHHHYHFSHYGVFGYNGAPGSKRAFCLEDTNRFHNDERTPLRAVHQSCAYQGITAGWGDEYEFGLPGQWVDITEVDSSSAHPLTFDSNPDHFLCEGTPVLDASGNPIFDPTNFTDSAGHVVSRMRCDLPANWHAQNVGTVQVTSATGSFVTEACSRGQIGPLRDCGFAPQTTLRSCTPGSTVTLRCSAQGSQVLRVCEKSAVLGGVACALGDSLSNTIVDAAGTTVTFACPAVRDAAGTGGYSVYQAPVLPSQAASPVTCTGW
jgi:hypothetical protein